MNWSKLSLGLILVFNYALSSKIYANNLSIKNNDVVELEGFSQLFIQDSNTVEIIDTLIEGKKKVKFKRGKAIIFCVLTGFLGGHRIYFGTHQRTPIIYSITLGGFGILPLIDLVHIIFTKDLSKFDNKSEIIMWSK